MQTEYNQCHFPLFAWYKSHSSAMPLRSLALTAVTSILLTATSFAAWAIYHRNLRKSIPSPRQTVLPYLSPAQVVALPYPPDLLPGVRDVDTPYGSMRVYEWGPEDGGKALLIHGDTTPSPVLAPIAETLVKRGCRVMLFGTGPYFVRSIVSLPFHLRPFGVKSMRWTACGEENVLVQLQG